jgi:hypothetical protein
VPALHPTGAGFSAGEVADCRGCVDEQRRMRGWEGGEQMLQTLLDVRDGHASSDTGNQSGHRHFSKSDLAVIAISVIWGCASLVPRRFRNLVGARDVRERSESAWRIWDVGKMGSPILVPLL